MSVSPGALAGRAHRPSGERDDDGVTDEDGVTTGAHRPCAAIPHEFTSALGNHEHDELRRELDVAGGLRLLFNRPEMITLPRASDDDCWRVVLQHRIDGCLPSRESAQLERLQRTVGAYRLVVGQPRQEDLLRYIGERDDDIDWMRIDLTPRAE
ncbi:hypothetical protein GCM10022240_03920 [Microbacterium kribbense]|uniref:Uncharacterized protein n=1 Tax=Microbacterium kribbense TaxID=433645 RepID=A0ABP7G8K6_9MICO